MRFLLAALCALTLASPAFAASAVSDAPTRKLFTPADAAREMARALKPRPAAKTPAPKPRPKAKPRPRPIAKRWAPQPVARRAARPAWRARRWSSAARRRGTGRAPGAGQLAVRQPYEPPNPIWIGDLYIQADGVPMWSGPNGTQLARLSRATLVVNMGRYGTYYKVEAPNGSVGFVSASQLGPSQPNW